MVSFTRDSPAPVPTVVLERDVWQFRELPNSSRKTRVLRGSKGQIVPKADAEAWGATSGKAAEGYYFGDRDVAPQPAGVERASAEEQIGDDAQVEEPKRTQDKRARRTQTQDVKAPDRE